MQSVGGGITENWRQKSIKIWSILKQINILPSFQNTKTWCLFRDLIKPISLIIIFSGGSREIETYDDILKFRKATGCSSVMVARSAEWNASVFRKRGKLPLDTMIRSYLKLAIDYDNSPSNTKYCIQNMLRELQESELGKKFLETQTLGQMR